MLHPNDMYEQFSQLTHAYTFIVLALKPLLSHDWEASAGKSHYFLLPKGCVSTVIKSVNKISTTTLGAS